MRTTLGIAVLLMAAAALTGCAAQSPAGTWQMTSIQPESARIQFEYSSIVFKADGTYVADTDLGGAEKQITGTYELDPDNKLVTLKDAGGETHAYHVKYCRGCGMMEIWNNGPERTWEAKLKRTK